MKYALPTIYEEELQRIGNYRTLQEGLAYEYESTLYRGSNRALVRLSLSFHPRERGYGGTVSFAGAESEAMQGAAAQLAKGMWQALAEFRLVHFALVVQDMQVATSGSSEPLLVELGERAIRHALNEARFQTHPLPGRSLPTDESGARHRHTPPEAKPAPRKPPRKSSPPRHNRGKRNERDG